ncbi:MAG TPA: LuxR C-terminal-related transcriptional regulator, partial [Gammaproteobacteria bacterium]
MPFAHKLARRRGRPPHDDVLTPAEWAIVQGVRHGLSNARIAVRRGVSRDAVKYHVRNAVAKLGLRDRADLQHWAGVPRSSAAYRRATNKEIAMTTSELRLGPIGQISRTVRDIDEACAWYGRVLGLKHLYTFGKLAFFDLGGTRLYLSAEGAEAGSESILYLRVDDIAAAYDELRTRGVEFNGAPHLIFRHADGLEE